jgi:hypothetical protein
MIDHERTIDFFADFDGKIDDQNVNKAINELK